MRKVGILTSGGDAPGMNAAIRAAVRSATVHGISVAGYRDGFRGLIDGNAELLDDRSVGNIVQQGGTILGTSRCPAFFEASARAAAAGRLRKNGTDALIIIGGDGSFRGAIALQDEQDIPVVGVPGTIDNDVTGTDETIGFDTAVNTAVRAIDQVRDTSEATGMMFFVEVMGRESGAIALATAVAAGASGVLVPGEREQLEELIGHLKRSLARGKRSHIIVVAEGDEAGGAFAIARRVQQDLQQPTRVVVLGHIQRGGRPTAHDRVIASQMGFLAVRALIEGRSRIVIAMRNGRPAEVPLDAIAAPPQPSPASDLLALAQELSG